MFKTVKQNVQVQKLVKEFFNKLNTLDKLTIDPTIVISTVEAIEPNAKSQSVDRALRRLKASYKQSMPKLTCINATDTTSARLTVNKQYPVLQYGHHGLSIQILDDNGQACWSSIKRWSDSVSVSAKNIRQDTTLSDNIIGKIGYDVNAVRQLCMQLLTECNDHSTAKLIENLK